MFEILKSEKSIFASLIILGFGLHQEAAKFSMGKVHWAIKTTEEVKANKDIL